MVVNDDSARNHMFSRANKNPLQKYFLSVTNDVSDADVESFFATYNKKSLRTRWFFTRPSTGNCCGAALFTLCCCLTHYTARHKIYEARNENCISSECLSPRGLLFVVFDLLMSIFLPRNRTCVSNELATRRVWPMIRCPRVKTQS